MKKFSGYEEVRENNFDKEKLNLGPHFCKIIDVKLESITAKNPVNNFQQLVIQFDITAPDEQEGFYQRRYKEDAEKDALQARWKGIYKLSIPKDDGTESDEKTKVNFKTFITTIEKSNEGYDWEKADWNENTLKGKLFGAFFGIREFENLTGEIVYFTECRFIRSLDSIRKEFEKPEEERFIPKVKLVDKTYMDYNEWLEKRKTNKQDNQETNNTSVVDDDDSLPF